MIFCPEKILIFDIYADYAQFKKYFTNMSPLTFSIPPRTVIAGIVGAIIGIDKAENPEIFFEDRAFISLKALRAAKKTKLPTNYLKTTKKSHFYRYQDHKPTNVEYLKDPAYRIYVSHHDDTLYSKLKNCLLEHKTHYTLNLGISSCLANFSLIGEFEVEQKKGRAGISSVIPKNRIKNIVFNDNTLLQQCTLPNQMKNDREVIDYKEFVFEINGGIINAEIDAYFCIKDRGENIVGM